MPRLRWPDSTNPVSEEPGTVQFCTQIETLPSRRTGRTRGHWGRRARDRPEPASPNRPHRPRRLGTAPTGTRTDTSAGHGSSAARHRIRTPDYEKIQTGDDEDPGGNGGRKIEERKAGSWPVRSQEPADPMCYIGLAGGFAPSTPARRYGATPRRFGPAVDTAVHRAARRQEHERRAILDVRWRTVARGRQALARSSASAPALRVTAAVDRAAIALAGQPARLASVPIRASCAAPLSRRTGPAIWSAAFGRLQAGCIRNYTRAAENSP